ncbi:twin-arginine translocation signal domain-containing protein [Candidatus Margulisiibacteriota bacterium]
MFLASAARSVFRGIASLVKPTAAPTINEGRRSFMKGGLALGAVLVAEACGYRTPPNPPRADGHTHHTHIDGSMPKPDTVNVLVLEDFSSCFNTKFNTGWNGFNGFTVKCGNGMLRAEGSGTYPGFHIVANGNDLNVSQYKYIELKIRGKVANPTNTPDIKIEAFVNNTGQNPEAFVFETVSENYSTIRLDINVLNKVSTLHQLQVMVSGSTTSAWIELSEVRLIG